MLLFLNFWRYSLSILDMEANFYIFRDGTNFGPYTREKLDEFLANGQVVLEDLAWTEGCSGWLPLSEILAGVKPPTAPGSDSAGDDPEILKKTFKIPMPSIPRKK